MSVTTAQPFKIGGVISQTFSTLMNNLVTFLVISLIVTVLMYVVIFVVGMVVFGAAMMGASGMDPASAGMMGFASLGIGAILGLIVIFVLMMAVNQLGVAAITYGTVQYLRDRKAGIGECLSRGLSVVGPVLGVAILGYLIVAVGAGIVYYILSFIHDIVGILAAVIVGVAGFIVLWVAVPVAVIERPSVVASLQRSVALSAGYRWHILGVFLLLFVIAIAIGIAVGIVVAIISFISAELGGIISFLLNIGFSLVITALAATLAAVGYYHLRVAKEGVDIGAVAKVFD
jgi:hypothetical protein